MLLERIEDMWRQESKVSRSERQSVAHSWIWTVRTAWLLVTSSALSKQWWITKQWKCVCAWRKNIQLFERCGEYIAALSFPSLCWFVRIGTTKYAIQTAKEVPLNNSSTNNYFVSMVKALTKPGDKGVPLTNTYYYLQMLKAIAPSSVGKTFANMEDSICSCFWKEKCFGNFVHGQNMYSFSTTDYHVHISKIWIYWLDCKQV